MSTMPKSTDATSPHKKLILKYGERKLLMHRLSKYEFVVTMARLEFLLSPIRPYMLLVDMAEIEPGSTAGLVEISRMAWDIVLACAGTPVVEMREVPGYEGEPEGEEARIRFWDFYRSEEVLERELGLDSSPASGEDAKRAAKDVKPTPKDVKPTPKDAKPTPKDTNTAPKDGPPAGNSDNYAAPKVLKPALKAAAPSPRAVKSEPKNTPLPPKGEKTLDATPARSDGKLEITICNGDEATRFLVKPSSYIDKVLDSWASQSGKDLMAWRFEVGGKPVAAPCGMLVDELSLAHGDKIYARERTPGIPFSIDWSSNSNNAGTMSFRMQPQLKIQKAVDLWCARTGYKEKDWVFEFCDEEIDLGDEPTLEDLGIEAGDAIYAVPAL
ncbi:hypothetical protein AURDEDRAFT_162398 [Auricularia subglabra TFB-10046 SS5]|nr:hypothetical protein AURDEDRAFT_162398 [Auricularia subglabra TFB-10046 SS5]